MKELRGPDRQAGEVRVTDQSRKYWQSGNEHTLSLIKAAGWLGGSAWKTL